MEIRYSGQQNRGRPTSNQDHAQSRLNVKDEIISEGKKKKSRIRGEEVDRVWIRGGRAMAIVIANNRFQPP